MAKNIENGNRDRIMIKYLHDNLAYNENMTGFRLVPERTTCGGSVQKATLSIITC